VCSSGSSTYSSGLSTSDFDDVSTRGINDRLQKPLSAEDAENTLADQAIFEILQHICVQTAGRVAAKYREYSMSYRPHARTGLTVLRQPCMFRYDRDWISI